MTAAEIQALILELDTTSVQAEEAAWAKLKPLGVSVVPYFAETYPRFRKWQGRVSLVFHSIRFARSSEHAFQLGMAALNDKSRMVRYRACGLLAYSLRKDALAALRVAALHMDKETVKDAVAAIDAISRQNHHLFVDRNHSGRTFWTVNDGDRAA